MKPMKPKSGVTHQDVQQAMQKFLKDGGLIVHLPDQQKQSETMVGGEKYQDFESLATLIS